MIFGLLTLREACYIALFVYFGSGLLPDPDGPFDPGTPHFHAWLIAIVFEIPILVILRKTSSKGGEAHITAGIGGSRIFLFILMTGIFALRNRRYVWQSSVLDVERESLLGNGAASHPYTDLTASREPKSKPVGWVDYLYGFRRLFPYIW
jgi:ATP-binding cassette, subfamily B, vacuolar membrane transporter HMT1/ACLQ